jgi:GNAT superfamily N-acetyltransferase
VIQLATVVRPGDGALAAMTFPAYRHLLELRPAHRLLSDPSRPQVQPLALEAVEDGMPIGLALVGLPLQEGEVPEMLSLFVNAERRNRGVGRLLVRSAEGEIARRGFARVEAVWTAGRPASLAVEHVLARCGWARPAPRTLSVRFTVDEAENFPWLDRYPLRAGCEIFPWVELGDAEREALLLSQRERAWIKPDLVPWQYDAHGFEPVTSVGMRRAGEVVGWVINHRTGPTTLRFTCAYIDKNLGRHGRIMPLFSASIGRLRQGGFTNCTFVTPLRHETMVAFIRRWMMPWVGFVEETRGSHKELAGAPGCDALDGRSEHESTNEADEQGLSTGAAARGVRQPTQG